MYHQFKELADVDITAEPMEVGPTAHYMMGGVKVHHETQESTVPGLFAAGEVGGAMHGSNRLGGNSLSDLLVFGKRAGEFAAECAAKSGAMPTLDAAQVEAAAKAQLAPFERESGENPHVVHDDLRKMMQDKVGIVRSEEDLTQAIEALAALRERAAKVKVGGNIQYNPGWHLALDLENMIDASEAIARAALTRKESRGAHTREDFPDSDAGHWGKVNLVIRRRDGAMEVAEEPLPAMPDDMQKILKGE
jgi:succinate dehydrogenase / fumarate reductase flavoprotein subunit